MVNAGFRPFARSSQIAAMGLLSLAIPFQAQQAQHYKQTNLVSNSSGAVNPPDPNLVNPWGVSRSSGSPWWVSDHDKGVATLYDGTGAAKSLVVTIQSNDPGSGALGKPTGQVFNGTNGFQLASGKPAIFIFVTEDGTVSGWNPGVNPTTAVIKVNTKGASVFKGVALATIDDPSSGPANYLYVADFRQGRVNVYNSSFQHVTLDEQAFRDARVPAGFAPFNVQNIGGNLYVAYAKQDEALHDEVDGPGLGFVDVFSPKGHLLQQLETGDWFNAPWGMAQAPSDFGVFSHDVLVGQFGSGQILVFDPVSGQFKGELNDSTNVPITNGGLWALSFGGGGASGPSNTLFFTAASNVFGAITAVENVLGGDQ